VLVNRIMLPSLQRLKFLKLPFFVLLICVCLSQPVGVYAQSSGFNLILAVQDLPVQTDSYTTFEIKENKPKRFPNSEALQYYYEQYGEKLITTISQVQSYLDKSKMKKESSYKYGSNLTAEDYVEVALIYQVPLKQMLAVGKLESHYGTNCMTASGSLTRPCAYKNIFSIGLTGSSSSGYATWKDGLIGFGKWYSKYQSRGIPDCQKWKIYNPNGDYCAKVMGLSASIGVNELQF
jgi:hypothetical protein